MTEENLKKHTEMIEKCNALTNEQIDKLIAENQCPYDPQFLLEVALGMFHCPLCGEMVIAGFEHPRELTDEQLAELDNLPEYPDDRADDITV